MSKTVSTQSTPQPRGRHPHVVSALAGADPDQPIPFSLALAAEPAAREHPQHPATEYVAKVVDTIRRADTDQGDAVRELVDMVAASADPQTAARIVTLAFDEIAAKVARREVEQQAVPAVRVELEAEILADPDGAPTVCLIVSTPDAFAEEINGEQLRAEVTAARARLDQLEAMADTFDQIEMEQEPRPCWPWCQTHHVNPGEEKCQGPSVHMGADVSLPVPEHMDVRDGELLRTFTVADYSGNPNPQPMISINSGGNGTLMDAGEAQAFADNLTAFAAEVRRMARRLSEGPIPEQGAERAA